MPFKYMLTIWDFKILFYLSLILIICLLPVWLFRRKPSEVIIIAGAIAYFLAINNDFLWGRLATWHDTMCHEYLMSITRQWLDANVAFGWNPYMNGGEPIYLNSNGFLWAPWVFFCFIGKFIHINSLVLFNLFWTFSFLNFCIGGFLVFMLLYDDFRIALFCFVALLLSGQFITMFGQMGNFVVIYYLPYVLFGFILAIKNNDIISKDMRIYGCLFGIVFFSISANHYLPHYLFLGTAVFMFFAVIFNPKILGILPSFFTLLKDKYRIILLALLISLATASPALFLYGQTQNYVSPSRGASQSGIAIRVGQTGEQPNVNAPLWGYRVILEQAIPYRDNIHHAFYFGIVPLLLAILALFNQRDRFVWPILFSSISIAFLSTGFDFWAYRLLIKYIPTFNLMRHSYQLSHFVVFYLICLCGFGLKRLLGDDINLNRALKLTILVYFLTIILISRKSNVAGFILAGAGLLILMISMRKMASSEIDKPSGSYRSGYFGRIGNFFIRQYYLLILVLLFVDLSFFYIHNYKARISKRDPIPVIDITYPTQRSFYSHRSYRPPPDLGPIIFKEASLTHPNDNYIFFRNQRLHDMLMFLPYSKHYVSTFMSKGPIVYFAQNAKILPENIRKKEFIETVYEYALENPDFKNKGVLFSSNDIDFSEIANRKVMKEAQIEYTKIDNPNTVEMTITAPQDGFLVRLENFHSGWKALVDGARTKIYRANYAFQAIRVPEGVHKARFSFSTIYPILMYIHVIGVFLSWIAFNLFLIYINKEKNKIL